MKKFIVLLSSILLLLSSSATFGQGLDLQKGKLQDPVSWKQSSTKVGPNEYVLIFNATVQPKWHFYSQYTEGTTPLMFTLDNPVGYTKIGNLLESPKPKEEYDNLLGGLTKYWDKKATFKQKIKITSKKETIIKGFIDYQACIEGACTQLTYEFNFKLPGATEEETNTQKSDTSITKAIDTTKTEKADTLKPSSADTIKTSANDNKTTAIVKKAQKPKISLLNTFLIALLAGMLALLTPCVFPMIPMTVSFFMKGNKSRSQGLKQAYFFGFSIITIFSILGLLLTVLLGKDAMYIISTHWIPNIIFFIIFMVFALSFFGLFEITLPNGVINKSDKNAEKGGYIGTFFVAFTTVLVSFSCTGPILGAALIELSSGANNSLVFLISMIGFALGFAIPFTLLAMFPATLKKLKSGSWLNTIKIVFGFLELALGLKFLSIADLGQHWQLLDRETFLSIWIVIFTLLGFYLLGKLRFKGDNDLKSIGAGRLFSAIITLSFVVYMIPGLWGAPLKVLSGYIPPMETQDFDLNRMIVENSGGPSIKKDDLGTRKYADELHLPTGFDGFFDLEEAKAYAKKVHKPIFVDFTGKTCANCREMESNVWTNPEVKKILNEKYVMVALYADANFIKLPENEWVTAENGKVIKTLGSKNLNYQITRFNMNAQPYYIIMDENEKTLTADGKAYDKHVPNFIDFLNEGLKNFQLEKK